MSKVITQRNILVVFVEKQKVYYKLKLDNVEYQEKT